MTEKYDIVNHLQYENLRKHHRKMVDEVLGDKYYNMGMDVYTCDEMTCDHIVDKVKDIKSELVMLKILSTVLVICLLVIVVFK